MNVLGGSCLAGRLGHYVRLTNAERNALAGLEGEERHYKRGTLLRREHDSARDLLIVQKGWLHSFMILHNGSRQITGLHLPGDIAGLSSLALEKAAESIVAVTDVTLSPFDKTRLQGLFADHPRLGALIFSLAMAERVALADRLASIGRTPARARVALFLCRTLARLRVTQGAATMEFQIPLTQEDIGDKIGLTAVHVNRMMRELALDGLIERSANNIRVVDEQRLAAEANFIDRYAELDTSWLPPPR